MYGMGRGLWLFISSLISFCASFWKFPMFDTRSMGEITANDFYWFTFSILCIGWTAMLKTCCIGTDCVIERACVAFSFLDPLPVSNVGRIWNGTVIFLFLCVGMGG